MKTSLSMAQIGSAVSNNVCMRKGEGGKGGREGGRGTGKGGREGEIRVTEIKSSIP